MEQIELTILMPCLNEEVTLAACIREAKQFLISNAVSGEILIADNASSDRSPQIAGELGARVIEVADKGYGNAIRAGIAAARGKYVIIGDCDMSYDFGHLMPFLNALREGCGLVVGNRFKGGIETGAMPFSHKYLGVPVLSFLGRLKYRTGIGDFHCGLRGINRCAAMSLKFRSSGMEFATEMIGAFAKSQYKITEVPTVLRKDQRGHSSHLRSIPDGLRHLFLIIKNK